MMSTPNDRRITRTRTRVLDAFRDLLFARGYDRVSVREITHRADVGRSTFYENFEGKEDVLRHSLSFIFTPLVASIATNNSDDIGHVLAHMEGNRELSRSLLLGRSRALAVRLLAALIADDLESGMTSGRGRHLRVPVSLAALHLAEVQIGLIGAWLTEPSACDRDVVADAFVRTTRAVAVSFLRDASA